MRNFVKNLLMNNTITSQFRVITPDTLNSHGTLFGGTAMKWMDEVAYINATKLTGQKMVTVKVNQIRFLHPVKPGKIIEITSEVTKIKNVSIEIKIEILAEVDDSINRQKVIEGNFIFAAVDESNMPVIIKIICNT